MYITYLGHSGFLFELTDCYIIVDYYEGSLPILDKNKTVYVHASHSHQVSAKYFDESTSLHF